MSHPVFQARAAVWRLFTAGAITLKEAQRRSRELETVAARPARHKREAPRQSRQYAKAMSTEAARDPRLVPQAKALLQVIRARVGQSSSTAVTKTTLASIMSCSARSIRRYLADLVEFGYVKLAIRTNDVGVHTGLVITILEKVRPFFEHTDQLAAWIAGIPSVTGLSPINHPEKIPLPWGQRNVDFRLGKGHIPSMVVIRETE